MRLISISFFILFFCLLVDCEWSTPSLVIKKYGNNLPSIYTDNSTGRTWAFYVNNTDTNFFLCYRLYERENEEFKTTCMKQERKLTNISVAGLNDGNTLYLAYSAKRNPKSNNCNNAGTDGCFDIFFQESLDAGKTWTAPITVPHPSSDIIDRIQPTIVAVTETSRIGISYIAHVFPNIYSTALFTTRAPNSKVFAKESTILDHWDWRQFDNMTMTYQIVKEQVIFRVFFYLEGGFITNFESMNNGNTWKKDLFLSFAFSYKFSAVSSNNKQEVYIVAAANYSHTFIFWIGSSLKWKWFMHYHERTTGVAYSPLALVLPNESHSFILTHFRRSSMSVGTIRFNSNTETLFEVDPNGPYTSYKTGGSFLRGTNSIAHVLHNIGGDLYLSTYTVTNTK